MLALIKSSVGRSGFFADATVTPVVAAALTVGLGLTGCTGAIGPAASVQAAARTPASNNGSGLDVGHSLRPLDVGVPGGDANAGPIVGEAHVAWQAGGTFPILLVLRGAGDGALQVHVEFA